MLTKEKINREKPFFFFSFGLVWQSLFFYLPLLFIIALSFMKYSGQGDYQGFSISNYLFFFKPLYFRIIAKSLALALFNAFLCFLIGYPLAYFLSFKAGKFKNFFLFLLILPFWTNFLLHIYAWFYVLEKSGFLNNFLFYFGLIKEPLHLLNSLFGVLMVMLYCYLPFMILPVYSILERVDRTLLEASSDLGAGFLQIWFGILLPLSMPGVLSGFFLVFVPSFGEFAIPSLVGGDKYIFVGNAITKYILGAQTMQFGAALTIIACIALILFLITAYSIINRFMKLN